jgi:glycosyltransferase involved in cell wall biosynthesis
LRFLFVHQNFPGQYLHIVSYLTKRQHDVAFLSEPNTNFMANVRKIAYVSPRASDVRIHEHAREFEVAVRRAEAAANAARQIKALGFRPDIIIGHHGWGELLNLQDVFPGVPILGYFEFFYNLAGQDVHFDPEFPLEEKRLPMVRSKNAVNLLALNMTETFGQTPTSWQLSTYPAWAHPRIHLLPEGVDLATCSPFAPRASRRLTLPDGFKIEPRHKLVTYMARNLEPYRGFHIILRALPALLAARPDLHVTIVGDDKPGYGALPEDGSTWKETFLREMEGKIDRERVHFLGQVPYETHIALLRRSDAHVYFTYPFVASWSLREAMAVGCAIIGSDTQPVHEFITHEETGLLAPFLEPGRLADSILRLLEEPKLAQKLRAGARAYAETHLDREAYLEAYAGLIETLTGQSLTPEAEPAAKPAKRRLKT